MFVGLYLLGTISEEVLRLVGIILVYDYWFSYRMNILINALGIESSGGIIVLDKTLEECVAEKSNTFFIVCNDNKNMRQLKIKYKGFKFIFIKSGALYRIFYENIFSYISNTYVYNPYI